MAYLVPGNDDDVTASLHAFMHRVAQVDENSPEGSVKVNAVGELLNLAGQKYLAGDGAGVRGVRSNLTVSASGSSAVVTITADYLQLLSTTGASTVVSAVSLSPATGGAVGANSLDAGSWAFSTWYYIFVIAKEDGTIAGLFSVSSTAPTLPSGYLYFARVGAFRTPASASYFPLGFVQVGNSVEYLSPVTLVANGTAKTTWTSIGLSGVIPPSAGKVVVNGRGGTAWDQEVLLSRNNTDLIDATHNMNSVLNLSPLMLLLSSATIYYICTSASIYLFCLGWEDNL